MKGTLKEEHYLVQNWWLRFAGLICLAILCPSILETLLTWMNREVSSSLFITVNAIVILLVAYLYMQLSSKIFFKQISYDSSEKVITFGKKTIYLENVKECKHSVINYFCKSVLVVTIQTSDTGKEKYYHFYSEDLQDKRRESASLWELFLLISE